MHGYRKLRLAEYFEMLRLTPDFETLRLTATRRFKIRKLRLVEDFEMFRMMCDFKTLRLTPARRQPDVTFRNQASGPRFQNTQIWRRQIHLMLLVQA